MQKAIKRKVTIFLKNAIIILKMIMIMILRKY